MELKHLRRNPIDWNWYQQHFDFSEWDYKMISSPDIANLNEQIKWQNIENKCIALQTKYINQPFIVHCLLKTKIAT